ncbi:MAG TPA: hypothetical protein VHA57_07505 [Actinomycetota bacterium]|nr:hypothetical protein [Actinomycetota bacterium]
MNWVPSSGQNSPIGSASIPASSRLATMPIGTTNHLRARAPRRVNWMANASTRANRKVWPYRCTPSRLCR